MTKGSLTSLFARAVETRPGQFFIRNAGRIGCWSFVACDIGLMGKDYLLNGRIPQPSEQLTGAVWLATDYILARSDKNPAMKIPAGIGFILGAALLGYSGMGTPGQNWQLFTSTIVILQGLALIRENKLNALAARMEEKKTGFLNAAFRPLAKYPVITTSAAGIAGMISLGVSALRKSDKGLLYVATLGILGNLGVLATDNHVKNLARANPPSPPSPSPQAA